MEKSGEVQHNQSTPIKETIDVPKKPTLPVKNKVAQRKSQVEALPIDECPTFRPTIQEFTSKSFRDLLTEYESQSGDSGIFKVRRLDTYFV